MRKIALSPARGAHFEHAALACTRCVFLMELPKTLVFWRADLAIRLQNGAPVCAACAFVRFASTACAFLTLRLQVSKQNAFSRARRAHFAKSAALASAGCSFDTRTTFLGLWVFFLVVCRLYFVVFAACCFIRKFSMNPAGAPSSSLTEVRLPLFFRLAVRVQTMVVLVWSRL